MCAPGLLCVLTSPDAGSQHALPTPCCALLIRPQATRIKTPPCHNPHAPPTTHRHPPTKPTGPGGGGLRALRGAHRKGAGQRGRGGLQGVPLPGHAVRHLPQAGAWACAHAAVIADCTGAAPLLQQSKAVHNGWEVTCTAQRAFGTPYKTHAHLNPAPTNSPHPHPLPHSKQLHARRAQA